MDGLEFWSFSDAHRKIKKSSFWFTEKYPMMRSLDTIVLCPPISKRRKDIIEMEEIERDWIFRYFKLNKKN